MYMNGDYLITNVVIMNTADKEYGAACARIQQATLVKYSLNDLET